MSRSVGLAILIAASLSVTAVQASEPTTVSLNFESQFLDLDTGTVAESSDLLAPSDADIRLAYNARRSPSTVVVPAEASGAELAFVKDVAFDGVTADSLSELVFSPEGVDLPFSAYDTVVVRTSGGSVFKLGNAIEADQSVTFNVSQVL